MQMDGRMSGQERLHVLRLVRREVISDDMDLAVARLSGDHVGEELDEGRAGMPRHRLSDNFAGAGVERREQREGAVAVVLESVTLCASRRLRQIGIESVERLNRRLFIVI